MNTRTIEVNETIEANGTSYATWYKSYASAFGNFIWGVTDWQTGDGVGGSTQTEDEAKQAITDHIRSLSADPDAYYSDLERQHHETLDQIADEREAQAYFDEHDVEYGGFCPDCGHTDAGCTCNT